MSGQRNVTFRTGVTRTECVQHLDLVDRTRVYSGDVYQGGLNKPTFSEATAMIWSKTCSV